MYQILTIVLLSTFLISCSKKDEDKTVSSFKPVASPFLTSSDFSSSNEILMDSSEVNSEMIELNGLRRDTSSSDNSSNSQVNNCFSDFKFQSISASKLYVGGEKDMASCFNGIYSNPNSSFNKLILKMYVEFECENVDLSSYSGQSLTTELSEQIFTSCGNSIFRIKTNGSNDYDVNISSGGSTYQYIYTTKDAKMTDSGDYCVETFNGTNWEQNSGCKSYNIESIISDPISTPSRDGKSKLTVLTSNSLVKSTNDTDPFFSSGSFTIYHLGWNGTITYAGPTTSPNWSMTDGVSTVTGTLTAFKNLNQRIFKNSIPVFDFLRKK